ncbi:ABC transporter substrate-binding protein [Arcobacter roscoffensis]|uniref:histidine kinase n=1 Tax=Arcobacter roscoffensis TaxID=2961520 RepID=A0ABY5E549_9BACT|nr:ABC transporter substrate-binding protein [Arcobacter roscoffensis]UTJ05858.1 ABC transporter substrate-binding protein [Arcobacter roscoffensis]
MLRGIFYFIFVFLISQSLLFSKDLKKVTIQLSWFDQFQFAGYYMAKEKGFYEEAGLDVTIKAFEFGLDIPNDVAKQKFDFAVGRETLILDKSKGTDIVALYALFQATPLILVSTKESGINSIEDFKNKNIMTTIDDASEVSLKAMIRSKNIRLEELDFIKHTHNINDLIDKKTDVISAYISKSPFELKQRGIEYNVFDPKKFGFDMYSDLLFTSKKMIQNDIDTALAFKNASLKGWEYAYSNIEKSADLILQKYNSQNLSKAELIYEGEQLKKLSYFNTKELGHIKKEKLQRIYDLYNIMGLTNNVIDFDDFIYFEDNKLVLTNKEKEYLKQKAFIKTCIIPNAMPYSDIKDGKVYGSVADFVKILEEKIKIPLTYIPASSLKNSLELIKSNQCDIIPTAQLTQDRKSFMNFTNAYVDVPSVIMTKDEKPFIENLSSLKDVKIGIVDGFSLYEILKPKYPNIEFVKVKSLEDGLERVYEDELYGQITAMGKAWYILQKDFLSHMKISGKIDEKIDIRIGVKKGDVKLYKIMSKFVNSLDDEKVEALSNKWVYVQHEKEFDYALLFKITFAIFILSALLLYRQNLLKKMNEKLNKKVEEKTQELKRINETLEHRVKEEVEENLKKDRLLARQSKMAAMGEMLENIAHQWRQPLSVISTSASGLKVKKQVDDLDDKFFYDTVDCIVNSSNYLSHTIDDFRYFFKPQDEKVRFDIADTLEKTINLLNSKFEQENITVIRSFENIVIQGHETEFIQVFINILNNAKDALVLNLAENRVIFVEIKKRKNKTLVKIRDNAGGIKPKILDKIFEPYFTTKHNSTGTGIGLYMCDQIISKYMNGVIDVSNKRFEYKDEKYKGAEFSVILYDDNLD